MSSIHWQMPGAKLYFRIPTVTCYGAYDCKEQPLPASPGGAQQQADSAPLCKRCKLHVAQIWPG